MAKKLNLEIVKLAAKSKAIKVKVEQTARGDVFLSIGDEIVFSLWTDGKYSVYPRDLKRMGFSRAK